LRRQALDPTARPLVVVTPKGLLRLKEASSAIGDLSGGSFPPGIDDAVADKSSVQRLVLCAGKVYYDLSGHEAHRGDVAVARIAQLYPFPTEAAATLVASYDALTEIVWAQEEPQNMGPWRSIR